MKLKPFQREDLARLALHDGAIDAKDTGLGKTFDMYLWPCLKLGFHRPSTAFSLLPKGTVLLVAPGDGHDQIISEGATHFRAKVTRLDSQATFLRLSSLTPQGRRVLPDGYYITSYTQLASNGVDKPDFPLGDPERAMVKLHQTDSEVNDFLWTLPQLFPILYARLQVQPDEPIHVLRSNYYRLRKANPSQSARNALDEAWN